MKIFSIPAFLFIVSLTLNGCGSDSNNDQRNLEVNGIGSLMLSEEGGSNILYSDSADLEINDEGILVTTDGLEVLGFNSQGSGQLTSIDVDAANPEPFTETVISIMIEADGTVLALLSNNEIVTVGQIALTDFADSTEVEFTVALIGLPETGDFGKFNRVEIAR